MLKYLRELPSEDLGRIRTAGDVYWHSIQYLLKEGMKNAGEARRLGLAADEPVPDVVQARSLDRARQLLGGIAFEMAATLVPRPGGDGDPAEHVPNFDGVRPGRFHRFKQCLLARLGEADRQLLQRDIDSLAALNDVISHGVFDTDVAGLDRILWRNRTLQEFFAAYWLPQHCRPQDAAGQWDWIYQPERPQTEEYYWVWRSVCEMHADARDPEAWTRAVETLFRPGDGKPQGTTRWSEMIYRAWQPLQETIPNSVTDIGSRAFFGCTELTSVTTGE